MIDAGTRYAMLGGAALFLLAMGLACWILMRDLRVQERYGWRIRQIHGEERLSSVLAERPQFSELFSCATSPRHRPVDRQQQGCCRPRPKASAGSDVARRRHSRRTFRRRVLWRQNDGHDRVPAGGLGIRPHHQLVATRRPARGGVRGGALVRPAVAGHGREAIALAIY